MADLLEGQRESWGTRSAFILAAVGSAVGLGNLWGFPYKLYSYGGGAFLIPYIVALIVVGIPLMILEFSLGHFSQRAAPDAFRHANKRFEMVGWWGIILGFVIITYYPVILAWCFSFLWYSIQGIWTGGELPWAGKGVEGVVNANKFFFGTYLGQQEGLSGLGELRTNILWPLALTWVAMYLCIFKGVNLVGKIVWLTVPLPWLMLLILTVRGLTLEGALQGMAYYLDPVWSELAKPVTWRMAFGQVFFSLSLAFGVMITYASFLHRKSDLNNNAAIVGISDFATSFVAGLAVFSTLGGMAFATQQAGNPVPVEKVVGTGPGLAFVAFPYALAQLPYSAYFSFVFFFALITLGIDSAFSISESVLASIVDKTGWRRSIVLPVMSLVGFGIGLVYITQGGLGWLDTMDRFVNGAWGIAMLGLLECVVLGWLWRLDILRNHANARSDWKLGKWWEHLVRTVIPVILGTLFFWTLLDDMAQGEMFITADGVYNWFNIVGLGVMAIAPVLAILFSLTRSKNKENVAAKPEIRGHGAGVLAFMIAVASGMVYALAKWSGADESTMSMMLPVMLIGGIVSVVIGTLLLERFNTATTGVAWSARWAGMLGVLDVSAFLAMKLSTLSTETSAEVVTREYQLTTVSYLIVGVVALIVVGGLAWCFYKAMAAAGESAEEQHADEV